MLWLRRILARWSTVHAICHGGFFCLACAAASLACSQENSPAIKKLGTIDLDLVETSPVVFGDRLYRFESVRPNYHANDRGVSYFRLVDVATGRTTSPFADNYALGSAFVEGDTMYVLGTPGSGASKIELFSSQDLEHWNSRTVLELPGWELFNTSMCKADGRYVMAIEVGGPPEVAGQRFTCRFAESRDLEEWKLLPEPQVFTKEKYSACPTIRWFDGWFYVAYLEALEDYRFHVYLVRSKDLATWEVSPRNPVLAYDDRDKQIASSRFSEADRQKIQAATNVNNSDIDFCDFEGRVVIYYSWGDQRGTEFLAEAHITGSQQEFLVNMFTAHDE